MAEWFKLLAIYTTIDSQMNWKIFILKKKKKALPDIKDSWYHFLLLFVSKQYHLRSIQVNYLMDTRFRHLGQGHDTKISLKTMKIQSCNSHTDLPNTSRSNKSNSVTTKDQIEADRGKSVLRVVVVLFFFFNRQSVTQIPWKLPSKPSL